MGAGWLGEIDPATRPPFVRMGTRALGQSPWLLDGDDVPDQLAEKHRILADHHDDVVAAIDGTEEPAAELLDAIERQLTERLPLDPHVRPTPSSGPLHPHPHPAPSSHAPRPPISGPLRLHPHPDVPPTPPGDRLHPIDAAGRLVAEDLCLLVRREGRWVLGAGSVCFPSHWRLRDKLGAPMAIVHGPVPDYRTDLADRVDRFLDRLRVGHGVWRRNWTVHSRPDLYAPDPPPPPDRAITAGDAGRRLWLRTERQTLTRLPRTGAIVFTIRTQQVQLEAVAAHPDLRARLARAVAAWPPHQVAYRGGETLRRPLVAWLTGEGSSL